MIDKEIYAAFKEHCKKNGLIVKFHLNKLIEDYLRNDKEYQNSKRIKELLNERKKREQS